MIGSEDWLGTGKLAPAELIRTQTQQVWVRLTLALFFSLFLIEHAPVMLTEVPLAVASLGIYAAYNLISLRWVRAQPRHALRMLLAPILDIYLVSMGLWLDGGIGSPVYIMYFIVIVGNGLRYGNMLLLYSQILSLIGLAGVGLLQVYGQAGGFDWLYLLLQLAGIVLVPGYTYILGMRLDKALTARMQAESDSMGLLDASPVPAFTYEPGADGELRISYANTAMGRMCGRTPAEIAGMPISELCVADDSDVMHDGCAKVLLQVKPDTVFSFDIRLPSKEHGVCNLMCQTSSMRWGGHLLGLCLMTDITGSEHMLGHREQAHRQAYMNSTLASMAHDFRNALTQVIGSAEVMQMHADSKQDAALLDTIMQAGEKGSEIVDQLPLLMQGDKPARGPIDLQATLRDAVSIARLRLPTQVSLISSFEEDLPAVFGYAAQIEQIVIQLIDNAAAAIQEAGRIEVYAEKETGRGLGRGESGSIAPAARIRVVDYGEGIGRNHPKPLRETGLAMVRRIVGWHQGQLDINAKPGQGSSVVIVLPGCNTSTDRKPRREIAAEEPVA